MRRKMWQKDPPLPARAPAGCQADDGMNRLDLLKPTRIGGLRIRNRLVCAAQNGCFDEQGELFEWAARSRGAFGLCLLEAGGVHPSSCTGPALFGDDPPEFFNAIARAAKSDDMRLFQRLSHGGHLFPSFRGDAPWAVSARPGPTGITGRAMSPAEIQEVRFGYVSAALMCQASGLDGVEISVCNGNLIQQFLSPAHNDRRDHYGGSCENRSRFLFETLRAVRAAVGPDFVVGAGLGGDASGPADTDAPGLASRLLGQLESERLVDYVNHFAPMAARPPDGARLPWVLTTRCLSLDHAADFISSGSADLVAFMPR